MAYRFHLKAPVGKESRRIMLEQVERAERQLDSALRGGPDEIRTGVHETRKGMKRIRALLKLIRPGLSDDVYKAENARFREVSALLSASRDQAVLTETLQKLGARHTHLANPTTSLLRHVTEHAAPDPSNGTASPIAVLDEARETLHATKHHIRKLRLDPDSFACIEEGLRRGFKSAVKFRTTAVITNDDEDVHSWRKAVQQHWRHMALLSRAWPDVLLARVTLARRISQLLGDDHDLSMLAKALRALPSDTPPELQAHAVLEAALSDQRDLRMEADLLSGLLFSGRPRAFSVQVREIWQASAALPDHARPVRSPSEATSA